MRINYDTLKIFNEESLTPSGDQMSCYWVIQSGVERILNGETITDIHKQLLIDLGIIEESEDEIHRRNIVGPFKFSEDGSTNS
jgi:hypothetical protein